jgi:membrane protein DedA with SNARE-associated domain/membrane-associated phospholipid phosphatase
MTISGLIQSLVDLVGANPNLALAIVFLVSAGEALFVIGLFVPSTVVLVAAGTMIGMGKLHFVPIFLAASLGAVIGDALSFWFGHVWKENVRRIWPFSHYTSILDKGEAFFRKHGGKSVFIGRFIPGVKAVIPGVAGIMGMSAVRFTIINVASAFAWAGAHIIPAIALGRGFDLARSANPRLAVLIVAVLLVLALTWYATRLALAFILPYLARLRAWTAERLTAHKSRAAVLLARILLNQEGALVAFALAALGLCTAIGFILLVISLLFEPELAASDQAVSNFLQTLRNVPGDRVMILVTMLADSFTLTLPALAFLAALMFLRRWRLAGLAALTFAGAAVFVPLAKSLLHRARPLPQYSGAEAFSFPSGHATLSIAIVGTIIVVLAHNLPVRQKSIVYAAAAAILALIAVSRIYLLAHWPSDVAAGLLFGGSLVLLLAFLLHGRVLGLPAGRIAIVLSIVYAATYAAHVNNGFAEALDNYSRPLSIRTISRDDWIGGLWKEVPAARILFDGEFAEPLVLQSDLQLPRVRAALLKAGWREHSSTWLGSLLAHTLPATGSIADLSPLHTYNGGYPAVATFTLLDGSSPDARLVLNIWPSQIAVDNRQGTSPLLSASVTRETVDPLLFGYYMTEIASLEPTQEAETAKTIAATIAGADARQIPADKHLFLVASTP